MTAFTDGLLARDWRCVACGALAGAPLPLAGHHRILGNREDNRLSNGLILCGTGNKPPGCHGLAHEHSKAAREIYGYIVSRHYKGRPGDHPVWYNQPGRGQFLPRYGWFTLTDTGLLIPALGLDAPDKSLAELFAQGA